MVKNTCKLHQTSTKCWSIMLKFGQNIRCHILHLTEPVLKLHLITVLIIWQYWLQMAPNSLLWGCVKIYLNLAK